MERFSLVSIHIRDLSLNVALTSMIMGLKSGPFSDNLCKRFLVTLEELRAKVVGFIYMEDVTTFREQMHEESSKRHPEKKEKIDNG